MQWEFCASREESDAPPRGAEWLATDGPMTAAAALRAAGQWSLDEATRDFDDETVWFRARFDAPPEGAPILCMDGLATHADVWLNGERILASDNMFLRHRIDVETLLRKTGNEVLIRCGALNAQLKAKRARPRWRAPMVANQQLRWWRTTLLGRTPGWSPPVAPVGPWGDVRLASREELLRERLWMRSRMENGDGFVEWRLDGTADAQLTLARDGDEWTARGPLRVPQAALWWPHTHGEPALYEARLRVGDAQIALPPIGFRTIEIDAEGGGFGIRCNGEPVFCRGAVWTPLDVVSLRADAQRYADALAQVRDAGMNMLRVAGTTVYEEDAFYEACDRAGVLVWQDFMFANMDYPAHDEAFAQSVDTEVRQQLQRLHAHASLAVLCGNSEAEQQAAMWGAPRDVWEQPLFHDMLPRLCEELAPAIAYWPSSAHGGALPQQPDTGTTSYYGVGAYLRPLADARLSNLRFATECLAFANATASGAMLKERTPRDRGAAWDFADVRDHYLEQLHDVDARELRRADPERYLELSRAVTGEVMARCFSEWRRPGSTCRGALVLMLRDLWPCDGWGLLDDQGVPKPCWDALERVLQPVVVLLTDEGMNGLYAHVLNESAQARPLRLHLCASLAGVRITEAERDLDVPARGAITVPCALLLDQFIDLNWSHRFGPRPCDEVTCTLRDASGAALSAARFQP